MKQPLTTPGQHAENQACDYLVRQGLKLITRNYRAPVGEIDLIMEQGIYLVFVEVRFRRSNSFGSAAETIDRRKQAKLIATALHYLQAHRACNKRPSRFDVISISNIANSIEWIQNAFEVQ